MKLNESQKLAFFVAVAVALLVLLFPPFAVRLANGIEMNVGYGFLFAPPSKGYVTGTINLQTLFVELLLIVLIFGSAVYFLKDRPTFIRDLKGSGSAGELVGINGWLLVLCIVLTVLSPMSKLIVLASDWMLMRAYFGLGGVPDLLMGIRFLLLAMLAGSSIYAGHKLWKIRPNALRTVRNYLILAVAIPAVVFILDYIIANSLYEFSDSPWAVFGILADADKSGEPVWGANTDFSTARFIISLLKNIVAVGVWYLYLRKSKRVFNTYGANL